MRYWNFLGFLGVLLPAIFGCSGITEHTMICIYWGPDLGFEYDFYFFLIHIRITYFPFKVTESLALAKLCSYSFRVPRNARGRNV